MSSNLTIESNESLLRYATDAYPVALKPARQASDLIECVFNSFPMAMITFMSHNIDRILLKNKCCFCGSAL